MRSGFINWAWRHGTESDYTTNLTWDKVKTHLFFLLE